MAVGVSATIFNSTKKRGFLASSLGPVCYMWDISLWGVGARDSANELPCCGA